MVFVEIKDLKNCTDVKELYEGSFPPEEKVDFYGFFSGVFSNFKLFVLYDEAKLVGMAHFCNTKNFIHLNYLAVDKKCQSKGYGTKIISFLKEKFNNKTIVVDVEKEGIKEKNNDVRKRRKVFYHKNGFLDGKYEFDWEGVHMTYMHFGEINGEEFMKYIVVIFPTIINIKTVY